MLRPIEDKDIVWRKEKWIEADNAQQYFAPDTSSKITLQIPKGPYWLDPGSVRLQFRVLVHTARGQPLANQLANPAPLFYPTPFWYPQNSVAHYSQLLGAPVQPARSIAEGLFIRVSNDISSLFSRLVLRHGTHVVEDILDYNLLNKILILKRHTRTNENLLLVKEGFGKFWDPTTLWWLAHFASETQTAAQTFTTLQLGAAATSDHAQGHFYSVELNLGLLDQPDYLPLQWTEPLSIDLYLASFNDALVSSCQRSNNAADVVGLSPAGAATAPPGVYGITNLYPLAAYLICSPRLRYQVVQLTSEKNAEFQHLMQNGGLLFKSVGWTSSRRIMGGTTGMQQFNFQLRLKSLRTHLAFMKRNMDIDNVLIDQSLRTMEGLHSVQWRFADLQIPENPWPILGGGTFAYEKVLEWLDPADKKCAFLQAETFASNWDPHYLTTDARKDLLYCNKNGQFFMVQDFRLSGTTTSAVESRPKDPSLDEFAQLTKRGLNAFDDKSDLQMTMDLGAGDQALFNSVLTGTYTAAQKSSITNYEGQAFLTASQALAGNDLNQNQPMSYAQLNLLNPAGTMWRGLPIENVVLETLSTVGLFSTQFGGPCYLKPPFQTGVTLFNFFEYDYFFKLVAPDQAVVLK